MPKTSTSGANASGYGPVYEIRIKSGLSQAAFAVAAGVSRSTVQAAERSGDYPPSPLAQRAILQYARERNLLPSNIV